MNECNYPTPPSHRTFNFGPITIDSNFDSGNCSEANKLSGNTFELWISPDHPNNRYRTWFHFSLSGLSRGSTVTFKIKNQQNQSRLLNEGLVPVYRQESSNEWKRIKDPINLSAIQYCEGYIEWPFRHTMTSDEKVFFAFFYPWSNQQNSDFLSGLEEKAKGMEQVYFHRTAIAKSIEGRPIQFVVISSNKGKIGRQDKIEDKNLFADGKKPALFNESKKGIVIGARVHPGEVPGSHVMTGILKELMADNPKAQLLRDLFVFYIFPIFNPDGVARGHYRVDTNGINLNRCYINPTIKSHPSIYAVRKIIMHLHDNNRFHSFLDLHAHAARKGTFIYGNWSSELKKQVDACLFPKIISMNSADFEYEGSNFTERNMNCKQKGDHMSKEGSGRVAMFKATKNVNCWTLECNYNMSKVQNILQAGRDPDDTLVKPTEETLEPQLITEYKCPNQKQPKQFFTIETYHQLGKQICQSYLDLAESNPQSRIDNPRGHFKSVQNLKMNLAFALLRMDPNRFESHFKKVYYGLTNSENKDIYDRALKALYLLTIKDAKIQNINQFLKDGDRSSIVMEAPKKARSLQPTKKSQFAKSSLIDGSSSKIEPVSPINPRRTRIYPKTKDGYQVLEAMKDGDLYRSTASLDSDDSSNSSPNKAAGTRMSMLLGDKLQITQEEKLGLCSKVNIKLEEFRMFNISKHRFAELGRVSSGIRSYKLSYGRNNIRFKLGELPSLSKRPSERDTMVKEQSPEKKRRESAKQTKVLAFC